jgi:outer membrane protein assembly factor BamB
LRTNTGWAAQVVGVFAVASILAVLAAAQNNQSERSVAARVFWKSAKSPCALTHPVVKGEILLIGSCEGKFYALEKNNGKEVWSYNTRSDGTSGSFVATPLLYKDFVLAGTDSGCTTRDQDYVYAFNQRTGKIAWKLAASAASTTFEYVEGTTVVFGTRDGQWLSVDAGTGKVNWRFQTASSGPHCGTGTSVVSDGKNVCFLGFDETIHCLEAKSGRELWKEHRAASVKTDLFMYKDVLYFGAADDHIYGLNPESGKLLVRLKLGATPEGRMTDADTDEHDQFEYIYASDKSNGKGTLLALSDEFGEVVWSRYSSQQWTSGEPEPWNGTIIAGNCQGNIVAYRDSNGLPQWKSQVDGCIKGFTHDDSTLYCTTGDGAVYAYQPHFQRSRLGESHP